MCNSNSIFDDERLKRLIDDLRPRHHFPPEVILADARGKLSKEGHQKIDSHIQNCRQCKQIMSLAQKYLEAETQQIDSSSTPSVECQSLITTKADCMSHILKYRDGIVKELAEAFVPKRFWPLISKAISDLRNPQKVISQRDAAPFSEFASMVFASDAGAEEEVYAVTSLFIDYVDCTCLALAAKCQNQDEIRNNLFDCICETAPFLGECVPDSISIEQIIQIYQRNYLAR